MEERLAACSHEAFLHRTKQQACVEHNTPLMRIKRKESLWTVSLSGTPTTENEHTEANRKKTITDREIRKKKSRLFGKKGL